MVFGLLGFFLHFVSCWESVCLESIFEPFSMNPFGHIRCWISSPSVMWLVLIFCEQCFSWCYPLQHPLKLVFVDKLCRVPEERTLIMSSYWFLQIPSSPIKSATLRLWYTIVYFIFLKKGMIDQMLTH